jgi:hypothetical protein
LTRLRKKKSNSIARTANSRLSRPSGELGDELYSSPERDGGQGAGLKARKDALRDAVKRIFSRRSKDIGISTVMRIGTPRHGHHFSESTAAAPHATVYQQYTRGGHVPPLDTNHTSPALPSMNSYTRVQSPSAALFPKSAKLQPMDLGNPFERPGLRRRKTLPSVVLSDREAAAVASVTAAMGSIRIHLDPEGHGDEIEGSTAQSPNRRSNRLSRSTDDLRNMHLAAADTPRSRRDEIKYWRSSIGQAAPEDEGEEHGVSRTQESNMDELHARGSPSVALPSNSAAEVNKNPQGHQRDSSTASDVASPGGFGPDMETSKELEDRVARLEAGLHDFQFSLKRLTADRDRHTDILSVGNDDPATHQRSSRNMPKTLTDTLITSLQAPLASDTYEYGYNYENDNDNLRPATSPQIGSRPRTPDYPPLPTNLRNPDIARSLNAAASTTPPVRSLDANIQLAASPPSSPPARIAPQYHHRHTRSIGSVLPDRNPGHWTPQTESDHTVRPRNGTVSPQLEANDEIFRTFTSSHQDAVDSGSRDLPLIQEQPQHSSYTVQSLYQMLADERLARRRLEAQLHRLRAEITDLHQQLAVSASPPTVAAIPASTMESPSDSYDYNRNRNSHNSIHTLPLQPSITKISNSSSASSHQRNSRHSAGSGNFRLREILRDVEVSPPGTAELRRQHEREAEEERLWRERQAQRSHGRSKSSKSRTKRDERIF